MLTYLRSLSPKRDKLYIPQLFNIFVYMNKSIEWDIAVHGDWLERQSVKLINESLPAYAEIWKRFIGHDGHGKMVNMLNISPDLQKARVDFSENHYTILESLHLMSHVQKLEELQTVKDFQDYIRVLNNLMVYAAHAGRIRDSIERCFIALDKPDDASRACAKLSEFYNERHVFVHGKKLPFTIDDDSVFHITKPKTDSTSNTGVGRKFLWDDISVDDMIAADVFMSESVSKLKAVVNGLLELMLEYIKAIISENSLTLSNPPTNVNSTGLSGHGITIISSSMNNNTSFPSVSGNAFNSCGNAGDQFKY